jgi:hypothetical protein
MAAIAKLTQTALTEARNFRRTVSSVITTTLGALASAGSLAASAELSDAIVAFGEWGVYKDEVACWIAANPDSTYDSALALYEQSMSVAFFYGSHAPQVSFTTTDCCAGAMSAHTQSYTMPLLFRDDTYFSKLEDDVLFLKSALQSEVVSIVSDGTGNQFMSFSTQGLQEAYNEVSRICDFFPLNSDEDEAETRRG